MTVNHFDSSQSGLILVQVRICFPQFPPSGKFSPFRVPYKARFCITFHILPLLRNECSGTGYTYLLHARKTGHLSYLQTAPISRHRRSVSEKRKILQFRRYRAKKNNQAGTDANGMTSGKFWRNSASRFDVGWSHGVTPRFRFAQSAPVPVPKIAWSRRNSSCFSRKMR